MKITQNHLPKLNLLLLLLVSISASASDIPTPDAWAPSPFELPPDDNGNNDYPWIPPPPAALCNSDDLNTLLLIKQAFNNPSLLSTWQPNSPDCCSGWDFIECDPTTGDVLSLEFNTHSPWRVTSDVPPIFPSLIGNLSSLISLVFINNVTGPIPSFLQPLTHLKTLVLSHNRFSGPIPPFLVGFTNLTLLNLDDNRLSGTIPAQLSQLSRLDVLSLERNCLTGLIPEGLFSLFKAKPWNAANLFLSSNKLKGPIPRSLGNVRFRNLKLAENELTGDVSFLFGKDKWLWDIDLSRNKLSFNMSELEMPNELISLYLNDNKIFGRLPESLVDVRSLSSFNVSYNRLRGQIPVGGRLQMFDASAYSHNKLCGIPLPPC